ncbi:MAG: DNA-binding protein [Candidatus Electrothrix sp. AR3]|nr:DNA-binding protein [Candidatus Electrothrix sp. AR3]
MGKFYIPTALMLALLLTGSVGAGEKKQEAAVTLEQKVIQGKVLESLSGAGYTYLLIEGEQGKVWVAIPGSKVEVGQEVAIQPGMLMKSFESKALKRVFESIIFSPGLAKNAVAPAAPIEGGTPKLRGELGASMDDATLEELSGGSSRAVVPAAASKVKKATGEHAKTVEECFQNAAELNNKKVQVKGKVVKFSQMIMGKNWIHLQDGSGEPGKNTHDLVVTTLENVEKDSIVTVEGILYKDKDFGAGYRYTAIIEDAKIVQ